MILVQISEFGKKMVGAVVAHRDAL